MNKPFKVSTTTTEVDVTAILPGSAPAIKVLYRAENSRGAARPFARQISVPDAVLFGRVRASVKEGERVQVTTITEWYDDGYTSYLADFAKIEEAIKEATDRQPQVAVSNGTYDFVQRDIAQLVIPPVRNPKNKVKS